MLSHFGHCAITPNRSGSLMSGPCSAIGALDLDHLVRVVGQRVEHAHRERPAPLIQIPPDPAASMLSEPAVQYIGDAHHGDDKGHQEVGLAENPRPA